MKTRLHKLIIGIMVMMMGVGCGKLPEQRGPIGLVNHINSYTVALMGITSDGEFRTYCTGVWVSEKMIVTANHCAEAAAEIKLGKEAAGELESLEGVTVYYSVMGEVDEVGKSTFGIHASEVMETDGDHDLALLRVSGKVIPEHESARLAQVAPGVGEEIHVVGQVKGLFWSYVKGIVSGYRESLPKKMLPEDNFTGPFMQVSAPIYFGNSGGGAFNSEGELVGIVSFMGGAPNTAMLVHLSSIRKLLTVK